MWWPSLAWKPWLWPGFRELGLDKSQAQALSPSQPKPHPARAQAMLAFKKENAFRNEAWIQHNSFQIPISVPFQWHQILALHHGKVGLIQQTLVLPCVILVLPLIIHSWLTSHLTSPSHTSPYNPFTSPHEQWLNFAGCRTIMKVTWLLGDSGRVSTHANDK